MVRAANADLPSSISVLMGRDQIATDDEDYVDAEVAARNRIRPGVEENNRENGDRSRAIGAVIVDREFL